MPVITTKIKKIEKSVTSAVSPKPFHTIDNDEVKRLFELQLSDLKSLTQELNNVNCNNRNIDCNVSQTCSTDIPIIDPLQFKGFHSISSLYYTKNQLRSKLKNIAGDFSILYMNSRSLRKNLTNVIQLLKNIEFSFDVIAIPET